MSSHAESYIFIEPLASIDPPAKARITIISEGFSAALRLKQAKTKT
ncbi:MAG: hypothetical protein ACFFC5_03370 [Promethearchaeota archaeon]